MEADAHQRVSLRTRAFNALCRVLVKPAWVRADVARVRWVADWVDRLVGYTGLGTSAASVQHAGIPGRWISVGEARPTRTILYLHGGGFVFRTPRTHAALAARLCEQLDARALLPDYRLAPEHPLPSAHDDCFAAYRWLVAEGYDPARIAIIGDSAGGLLALSTLQRIRDAGLPPPACAVMFSPGSDVAGVQALDESATRADPLISDRALALLKRVVFAPVDPYDPAISPCAGNLAGLPPLLIQVGSTEALLQQSRKAAEMAHAAGTKVELQIWRDMPHVFQAMRWLPESRQALARVVAFVLRNAPDLPRSRDR